MTEPQPQDHTSASRLSDADGRGQGGSYQPGPAPRQQVQESGSHFSGQWPTVVAKARDAGYGLAMLGSLNRDLDVLAVPWAEPQDEDALIRAFVDYPGVVTQDETDWRGWRSVVVQIGGGRYFDLKVARVLTDHDRRSAAALDYVTQLAKAAKP